MDSLEFYYIKYAKQRRNAWNVGKNCYTISMTIKNIKHENVKTYYKQYIKT